MAILDIIITHYKEPWYDGRKMFEMLRLQRGVREGDFRVILVQDGKDDHLDLDRIMKVYPFVNTVAQIDHSGVSAARNAGLQLAEAEWVMFCDFDDMLYACDSMNRILTSLAQAGDKADLVWAPFWIEMYTRDTCKWYKKLKEWNSIFIHGKIYRREFLLEKGIWFSEELTYSEDAMFNALVTMECELSRSARMPEPVYVWCYRPESLSNYTGGEAKRNASLYRKRVMLCEAYEERGQHYNALCAAGRMLMDYYWELNGAKEAHGHTTEEWIRMIREDVLTRWPGAIEELKPEDRAELFKVTRQEATDKQLIRKGMPGMEEWLRKIGAIR